MAIYLKADGVQGNVTSQGFQNQVAIEAFRFGGIKQHVTQHTGKMKARTQGTPQFGLIALQKIADMSTLTWFGFAHSSKVIPTLELAFVTAGDSPTVYQKMVLSNALVSFFDQDHAGSSGQPNETLVLAYESLQMTYTPRNASNSAGSPRTAGYSLSTASKL